MSVIGSDYGRIGPLDPNAYARNKEPPIYFDLSQTKG
jgi:hypothetical protein